MTNPVAEAASEIELCPVCAEPFKAGDQCATDIELGMCHAACLEGSPTVDLDTGEPTDGPIATYPYEPLTSPTPPVAAEAVAAKSIRAAISDSPAPAQAPAVTEDKRRAEDWENAAHELIWETGNKELFERLSTRSFELAGERTALSRRDAVEGWRPITSKDDRLTCPMPADETVVDVMLKDGTVCRAWYSCNIMEAGDWDFVPARGDEPDNDAESIASDAVAWRSASPSPDAGREG